MLPPLPRCSGRAYSSLKLAHLYQPSPKPLSGRPAHRPFRGLLGVHSRCGLHTRAVTKTVTVIQGFRHFVTSMPAPVASGWSGGRAGLAPAGKAPPCHGARGKADIPAQLLHTLSGCSSSGDIARRTVAGGRAPREYNSRCTTRAVTMAATSHSGGCRDRFLPPF